MQNWITTYTGKKVDVFNPDPDQINIKDIAHALAMTCRFSGHCHQFYSVAQHSISLCDFVEPKYKLTALLHDAAEAYITDIPSPIKHNCSFSTELINLENCLLEIILNKYGGIYPLPDEVKRADKDILEVEFPSLIYNAIGEYSIEEWLPRGAELRFLTKFKELS